MKGRIGLIEELSVAIDRNRVLRRIVMEVSSAATALIGQEKSFLLFVCSEIERYAQEDGGQVERVDLLECPHANIFGLMLSGTSSSSSSSCIGFCLTQSSSTLALKVSLSRGSTSVSNPDT